MNIGEILKKAGKSVIRNVLPGGGLLVDLINEFIDDPIDQDSTGDEVLTRLKYEAPELLLRRVDLQLEEHHTLQAMLNAPQTTRPRIALGSFYIIGFSIVVSFSMWSYGVINHQVDLVTAVTQGWPFVLSLTGPLVTLLLGYFGILRKEHDAKLGMPTQTATQQLLNKLMK